MSETVKMTRVVKDPEVRRQELLDTAEVLFLRDGYDATSISDIVKSMNVAHGLFYYYFKSKSDALTAVIERSFEKLVADDLALIERDDLDAPQKLLGLFSNSIENRKVNRILDYIHEEKNALIHYKLDREWFPKSVQYLARVVEQGIEEKVFRTDYPLQTAAAILMLNSLVSATDDDPTSFDIQSSLVQPLQEMLERVLGAQAGTLDGFEDLWTGLRVEE